MCNISYLAAARLIADVKAEHLNHPEVLQALTDLTWDFIDYATTAGDGLDWAEFHTAAE